MRGSHKQNLSPQSTNRYFAFQTLFYGANMFLFRRKLFGGILMAAGLAIVLYCGWIFEYLICLFRPEKIMGKEFVIYTPEGCFYTNPVKMQLWCAAIASLGIAVYVTGHFMLVRRPGAKLPEEKVFTALAWPDNWKKTSTVQNFFIGTPFVGLDRRIFRAFKQKLGHRNERIHNLWPEDLEICSIRDEVSTMLAKIFDWPNTWFHPDDPCDILFWSPRGDLEIVEMFLWIKDKYGVSLDHIVNRLDEMSFLQLIEQIRAAMQDHET